MAMVKLTCEVCGVEFFRKPYEVKRNAKLGRANLHNRKCHAIWMNRSEAKLAQTREMLAERNSNQYREDNPHWKGGVSKKLKPLPTQDDALEEGSDGC